MHMNHATCPLCEKQVDELRYLLEHGSYKLYACPDCDMQFWSPRELVRSFYEDGDQYTRSHIGAGKLEAYHRSFFKHFPFRSGRLLDIGCGDGAFLTKAQEMGFEVHGIDLDRKSVAMARTKRGLENVHGLTLDEFIEFAREKKLIFKAVTFFEVLEHQDSPRDFLAKVSSLLEPGGFVAGSVPNRERMIIHREDFDYPPNHFTWWSAGTLGRLFSLMGFRSIRVKTDFELKDSIWLVEVQLLGRFDHKVKTTIKRRLLGIEESLVTAPLGFSVPQTTIGKGLSFVIGGLRDAVLVLPALALAPWLKPHLYFQGAKRA